MLAICRTHGQFVAGKGQLAHTCRFSSTTSDQQSRKAGCRRGCVHDRLTAGCADLRAPSSDGASTSVGARWSKNRRWTSARRPRTPTLSKMCDRCSWTVYSEMHSAAAISCVDRPARHDPRPRVRVAQPIGGARSHANSGAATVQSPASSHPDGLRLRAVARHATSASGPLASGHRCARTALQVSFRLRRERSPQRADRDPYWRWEASTFKPVRSEVVELAQIAFGGWVCCATRPQSSRISTPGTLSASGVVVASARRQPPGDQPNMRGEPPEERHLARVEIWTTTLADEVDPTPLFAANDADRQRLVAQAQRSSKFAEAWARSSIARQSHRKAVQRECGSEPSSVARRGPPGSRSAQDRSMLFIAKGLRSKHPRQEAADRIVGLGAVGVEWRESAHPRCHSAQRVGASSPA